MRFFGTSPRGLAASLTLAVVGCLTLAGGASAGVGVGLAARRKGQPAGVIAIADKAQHRLCRRFRRLAAKDKPAGKVVVAVARELTGFIWAALQPVAA